MKIPLNFGISIEIHDKDLIPKKYTGLVINNELNDEEILL